MHSSRVRVPLWSIGRESNSDSVSRGCAGGSTNSTLASAGRKVEFSVISIIKGRSIHSSDPQLGRRTSYAAKWKIQIRSSSFQLLLREKTLIPATFVKFTQTCLFRFCKAEAQAFPVIAATKIGVKIYLFGDQAVDVGYVFIAYFP